LPQVNAGGLSAYGQQQSVFLDVVETVDGPKRVIAASVRLKRVDRRYGCRSRSLHFVLLPPVVLRAVIRNGEIDPARLRRIVGGVLANQLVRQMIKGAPQVLNRIAGGQRNRIGDRLNTVDVVDRPTGVLIAANRNRERLGGEEVAQLAIEFVAVLLGPLYLQSYMSDSFVETWHNYDLRFHVPADRGSQ
jgi:hypothetical protein